MFLVTGGAGFIGSNIVASLNEAGATDVAVSDWLGQGDVKWRNLAKRQIADFVPPADLARWLEGRRLDGVIQVDPNDAKEMARRCAREEGILVGVSSGATLAAISQKLAEIGTGKRVLGFNYDTGERYLSVPDFLPEA